MAPPRFQRVVIYGVGLLGGSLGMALQRRGMASSVVGLGRSMERLDRARQLGAITECATDAATALAGADALILCIPPRMIREKLAALGALIEPGCFVTDVGSVKARIVAEAEAVLPEHACFIGSHPMAGSEKTGAENGRSDFYEASACIITPTEATSPETINIASGFWQAMGATVLRLTPETHDRVLAELSHLPHVVAAAMMQTIARSPLSADRAAPIAGNGLRDTTRIAGADPELWRQICCENHKALRDALDSYIDVLNQWRTALDRETPDSKTIGQLFTEGSQARQQLDQLQPESDTTE